MTDSRSDMKKRKYRSDGTAIWEKRTIDGPGVWVSCVKGKEKQTVGELYDLFEFIAEELWPPDEIRKISDGENDAVSAELSIEDQINKEVAAIKRPRTGQRFENCQTSTPCVIFMSCKPPINPVQLVEKHIQNVKETGVTRTRYTHRFVPISGTCLAKASEIQGLCKSVLKPFFCRDSDETYTYKVELRIRNHTVLSRAEIVQLIADCVPPNHKVDLTNPQFFILVEVFKAICGVSVTEQYYTLSKFNVMKLATAQKQTATPDA